jgi:hypothetical protein
LYIESRFLLVLQKNVKKRGGDLIADQNSQFAVHALQPVDMCDAATTSQPQFLLPGGILLQHVRTSTEAFSIAVVRVQ